MNTFNQELERRILYGLTYEWKTALLILKSSQQNILQMPLFSIRDMDSRLGYWSRSKREITLSRKLVLNHSWDTVKEVLLHEIAHQYADEVLFAYSEPPHGPSFQRACYLLRANPMASDNNMPLDERLSSYTQNTEDKIIRQVRKLLSLAGSKNEFEAESAMTKAHDLLARHNIELFKRDNKRDFLSVFLGKPALRHTQADYLLANLLQDFYFVKGIWVSTYILERGKIGRVLEISGTIQNIHTASYVYDFICNFINSKWINYNKNKGLNHFRKIDFSVGVIEGFRSKLLARDEKTREREDKKALIKLEDPLLIKYLNYRYPHTRIFRRGGYCQDQNVLNDGRDIGKKLIIFKGISDRKGGDVHLLEH